MVRLISLGVLLVLIIFLGITFYQVVAPFLLPLFLAGVVTILCRPLHGRILRRLPDRPRLASGLTTGSVLAIILVPLLVGVLVATLQLYSVAREAIGSADWDQQLSRLSRIAADWGLIELSSNEAENSLKQDLADAMRGLADRSAGIATKTLGRWVGSIVSMAVGVAMFGIALYYFMADGPALLAGTRRLIPVKDDYQQRLLGEFETVVRSVVTATLLAAVVQGGLTAIALWVVGAVYDLALLRHFFLFFVLATLTSLVPVTGAWLIWAPAAIWLGLDGHTMGAVVLTAFGVGVIGMLDNVIRVHVLQTDTKLHPLLAFVSVLGGVHAMGLWGVFIGPIVACCLHALVGIFNAELGRVDLNDSPETEAESVPDPDADSLANFNPDESPGEAVADSDEAGELVNDSESPPESTSVDG
ncbi:MAG: AI-2E family transporter [Planctomycetota bacterium]|nr:AI-2E family transporter [Planctomycetota bacterium]